MVHTREPVPCSLALLYLLLLLASLLRRLLRRHKRRWTSIYHKHSVDVFNIAYMLSAWTDPTDDLQQPSNYTGDRAKGHILNLWRAGFNIPRYAEELIPCLCRQKKNMREKCPGIASSANYDMIGGSGHNTKYILLKHPRRSPLVELFLYNHSELAIPPLCRNKQFHMSRAPFLVIAQLSRGFS